jgi:hypothetical protein
MADDLDRYFQETTTEIHFLDPMMGTKLSAHEPPPSVRQDPLMSRGLTQLTKMAKEKRITVQLLQSIHWGAEDFQDMVRDSGRALPEAKIVGIEMNWESQFDANQNSKLSAVKYNLVKGTNRQKFQEEQLSWLNEHQKIVVPCEYPENYESKFKQSYDTLLKECWKVKREDDKRKSTILWGHFHFIRQWVFLGTLGYWLNQLEIEGALSQKHLKVPFMSGSGHWALKNKLNDLAIPFEYYTVENRTLGLYDALDAYDEAEDYITAHAKVTCKQLDDAALPVNQQTKSELVT